MGWVNLTQVNWIHFDWMNLMDGVSLILLHFLHYLHYALKNVGGVGEVDKMCST
jgi:hypothetical protein